MSQVYKFTNKKFTVLVCMQQKQSFAGFKICDENDLRNIEKLKLRKYKFNTRFKRIVFK